MNDLYKYVSPNIVVKAKGQSIDSVFQNPPPPKKKFSSRLYLNILHDTTCRILCIRSTFRRVSLVNSPEQYKHSASISEFLHQFLREWVPHNLRSLSLTTLFISSSPRTTETFASLGPDCFFLCNHILEDFL
jgi:hypothetical protein